jgi:hypothetical protein
MVHGFTSPSGNVRGPASSTDNAIARFDGTTGRVVQNSGVTIDDSGNVILPAAGDIYTTGWTDYSATSTITGFGAYIVKILNYKKVGNTIFVQYYLDSGGTAGTGTAVSFTLPAAMKTQSLNILYVPCTTYDNAWLTGTMTLSSASNTVSVFPTALQGNWTNATRRIVHGQFWYEI